MGVSEHRFLKVRRTLVDVSSAAARRDGILMYRPGRAVLRLAVRVASCFAWLPWPGRIRWRDVLDGFDLEAAIGKVKYVTIYTGNGSARSKYTLKAKMDDGTDRSLVVKAARTAGGGAAIEHEAHVLRELDGMDGRVPRLLAEGRQGAWTWSAQSELPAGESPVVMGPAHREFLEALKAKGYSHGDFAPWNCAIAKGRLVVWDWEEAHDYVAGEDERHFAHQVQTLLTRNLKTSPRSSLSNSVLAGACARLRRCFATCPSNR